jgi:hypothetical protein
LRLSALLPAPSTPRSSLPLSTAVVSSKQLDWEVHLEIWSLEIFLLPMDLVLSLFTLCMGTSPGGFPLAHCKLESSPN